MAGSLRADGRMADGRRQNADVQKQCNADNTARPSFTLNPMVMGNNTNENSSHSEPINKDNKSFISELIINENQGFFSEQLRENDMAANIKQTSERDNNNSESFISDQAKDPDIDANTIQTKKKRKQKKKKNNSKADILENNKCTCEHDTTDTL